jgi:hypothetical protein
MDFITQLDEERADLFDICMRLLSHSGTGISVATIDPGNACLPYRKRGNFASP